MKLSLEWLSTFVDVADIAPQEIAEQLSVRTAEVEECEVVKHSLKGVLVAEILSAEPLPDQPKLQLVQVGLGGRKAQTVCGAPNVRPGMKAAFASAGCTLGNGVTIETTNRHGVESQGVLCSARELGLGTAHEKLLELPGTEQVGVLLTDLCPTEDVLIEIDNKSLTHRPDLWGHYGFARELAAIYDRPLLPYELADLSVFGHLPAVPIEIENERDCPVYTALEFTISQNVPAPIRLQRRLLCLGMTSRNLIVDLTNYIQVELGQPTHTFDADLLGDSIRIARSKSPVSMRVLDGTQCQISAEDLLILGGDTPAAVAGVMGGFDSQIQDSSRRVVLESANFDGTSVRRTSSRIGIRTDSSLRFEKKLPPVFAAMAAGRFVKLLMEHCPGAEMTRSFSVAGNLHEEIRPISIGPGYLSRRAGTDIPDAESARILQSIGFDCEITDDGGLEIGIPPFRTVQDISIPEDISEEVMRLYGYDQITPQLPACPIDPVVVELNVRGHHRQRRILSQSHRFVEVQSYGWLDDAWVKRIGYEPKRPLLLQNPSASGKGRMRDRLLPNLLAFAHQNRKLREGFSTV